MIDFTHVTKSYEENWKALNNVTFRVNKGEFVFLTGHSGAGKSTVLKLIYMDERPDEDRGGQVMVKFTGDCVYDSKNTPDSKIQALRRKMANRCVRFSGLEFSRGKKIRDFKNLAASTRSEDEEMRLALVRATYESALLGAGAFVKLWDILREFSVAMRQGGDHARDAIAALMAKNKSISKFVALYLPDHKENTLFERLAILGSVQTSNDKVDLSVKDLREKFRVFLKARFMKDHELKNARDILSKMERMPQDDPEYPELYLQACALLEDFEILKFKRKGNDAEEVIEDDALAKRNFAHDSGNCLRGGYRYGPHFAV